MSRSTLLRSVVALLAGACCLAGPASGDPPGPGGRAVLSGKIVDGSGAPVAGARLTLHHLVLANGRWGRFRVARERPATDASGAYRFADLEDGYYMTSVEKEGFARVLRPASIQEGASQAADVVLRPPASPVFHVEDRDGKPVAGARVRELTLRGVNGECKLTQLWMPSLGVSIPPSDERGDLRLPAVPSGDLISATIEHALLAPARTGELKAGPEARATVRMQPGVPVTLHIPIDTSADRVSTAVVDLRHEPFDDPSTIIQYEVSFDSAGTARLTVAPGDYSWFLLQNERAFLTPVYSANHRKKDWLRIEPGRNQDLHVEVRRKVPARGRVVDAETGKPVRGMAVMGELANGDPQGWADPPGRWSFAGWGESDAEGRYTIDLAPGLARLSFEGEKRIPERDKYEVTVASDGSTVLPDIKVRPLAKVVGIVRNPDGSPAARVLVRPRGLYMKGVQPVLTDDAGRFEFQPEFLPVDAETGERLVFHPVVAMDPYRPLAARGEFRLDRPGPLVLTLEPHEPGWPLSAFPSELSEWERGVVDPARAAKGAAVSLRGQAPPEIDAAAWLNTDGRALTSADLRGKYVLLDFWFIGCGPCHGDFPSVKLIHELYGDRGVRVIGIHNNSSTPDAVREHVARIGLPFAVAVDHADGRTVARFEEHGLPNGYPDYVLLSPEGKVLLDDRTIPHPTLRGYKLEVVRRFVLESQAKGK
ncbi:Thiol-disulfide oxidoreductase ResA [Aquisphaera giovannonii]|uniref:Thiol-disulfide oxidoreductase ResA n=1 Tax=Aquisphaera giovannonii TaxID=406548 RepID=A0A5B9W5V7_9BACT|nr:carboxypeptidase regulatory-like domain-containing protein [Aquisphaera giovannonii]QEH36032.1 Thiol-disulfide oxidoreductase ResA [Aquisphaera giovannonii]